MSPDDELLIGKPTAKIMLLGTFHFHDAGLDGYKPQYGFDVFSEQRQREIAEVVELLAAFGPTKVAIERTADQQEEIDQSYGAFLRSEFELSANEIHQLGFRLARCLGHERVYCVNAWDRYYEPPVDCQTYMRKYGRAPLEQLIGSFAQGVTAYARDHGQEHLLLQWAPRFRKLYEQGDLAKTQRSLRQTLLDGNTEQAILRSHGAYLVDRFKVGVGDEYVGADWATAWFNRNLRIFANLQRITESPDERLLLIIGAGHLPILRHCVQASPEYDLVEVHEYLEADSHG
ncbi:MAG: DUF5694 domain-containing protein [Chloroflexota bacterium]